MSDCPLFDQLKKDAKTFADFQLKIRPEIRSQPATQGDYREQDFILYKICQKIELITKILRKGKA